MNVTNRLLFVNHAKGRKGYDIDLIVIHVTEGSASSVRSWFNASVANVSAHYMVCVDGTIDQFVDEEDTAWHAGRVVSPTAPLVMQRPGVNPNLYSIGIEHEGTGSDPLTAPQRAASVALIQDICARRGIPIDREHIVGHHEIYAPKTCPGAIDVNALVLLAAGTTAAPPPIVVYSPYLGDYLVVTHVVSDTEWYFVPASKLATVTTVKSTQSLSAMPRRAA